MNKEFKSGFIAIIGRPNVGKSTLINNLVGRKIAIMSDKPQTTRNEVIGILTKKDEYQLIFVDTPGIHKPKSKLGNTMVETAFGVANDVDVILFVIDATSTSKEDTFTVLIPTNHAYVEAAIITVINEHITKSFLIFLTLFMFLSLFLILKFVLHYSIL